MVVKVLVVEDDDSAARAVNLLLTKEGFNPTLAMNGDAALRLTDMGAYDAAIVDLMLPGMSGRELVVALREARHQMPVLMLSANADLNQKVRCINAGVDDYLTKPYVGSELIARIGCLLRREKCVSPCNYAPAALPLDYHGVVIDRGAMQLIHNDRPIEIEHKVLEIFVLLLQSRGQLVRYDKIATAIAHPYRDRAGNKRSLIQTYVSRLRLLLRPLIGYDPIKTVQGEGYCLEP